MRASRATRSGRSELLFVLAATLAAAAGCEFGVGGLFGPGETREVWIRMQGTVTAAADGRPLEGATVEEAYQAAEGSFKRRPTTDATGRYTLWVRQECSDVWPCWTPAHLLVAHLEGFERGLAPRTEEAPVREIPAGADTVDVTVNFALRPARPFTLTVDGEVRSLSTGRPLAGAAVVVDWDERLPFEVPEGSATTDEEGRYLMTWHHFCEVRGSACLASFEVRVGWRAEWSYRLFDEVDVAGDSIRLTVDFEDF